MRAFNIEDVLFLDIETSPNNNKLLESERVICICVGKFGQDSNRYLNLRSFYNENEAKLLLEFNSFLLNFTNKTIICVHNDNKFNFRFLLARMTVNGLVLPAILNAYLNGLNKLDTTEFICNNTFKSSKNIHSLNIQLDDIVSYSFKDIVAIAQKLLKFKNLSSVSTENIYYV
jgi:DNA polymerase elongation subunit (family B)